MPEGISEEPSENTPRRRRGRPAKVGPAELAMLRGIFGAKVTSTRGLHDAGYRVRAHGLLSGREDCRWLVDPPAAALGVRAAYRVSILAELGRIDDDADLIATARRLCELRPTAREAVRMVRRARTGQAPAADALALANLLIGHANAYARSHAGATRGLLADAARALLRQVGGE